MNSKEKERPPLMNIERNPLMLLICTALTVGLFYLTYITIFNKEAYEIKPYGFFLVVPSMFISFQTLWFLVNPFALLYEDKLETKHSLFHNKRRFYVDIKRVSQIKNGSFTITYNDDEVEKINLFGIRTSHISLLREELNKQVVISLEKRALIEI